MRGTLTPDGQVAAPKSRSSRRRVPLAALGRTALRRHRLAQMEERLRAANVWHDGDFVFTNDCGRPAAPMALQRVWRRSLEMAGCQQLLFHATRHTAASLMVAAGVNPRVAAERLGHAAAAMTLDRYSHLTDTVRADATQAIDAVVQSA